MTLYILFPIGIYYYFNHSETIERWIEDERKKHDKSNTKEHIEFRKFVDEFSTKRRMKELAEMEAEYNKMKMT